jgi:serine/threonine protein kinase
LRAFHNGAGRPATSPNGDVFSAVFSYPECHDETRDRPSVEWHIAGLLGDKKMFDPTQTQPLSWRMHQGKPVPSEEVPMDGSDRHEPGFDSGPPDLSERGYRLRGRLGSGRLGPIYEAQDELSRNAGSQHFAAVQLIDERISSRPGFSDDFERGAAELKSIAHPNIVKLLEYGRDRNRYYLVNELLESASLRFVLNDVNALPPEETTAVLRAVGDALQYLHAKGMVHGNLKTENVLVTFGYDVKLLDIVPGGWLVNPNDALGVPARAPDKRDDVFGIACLAYEMLSGRHPYNGNTAQEAYRAGLEPDRIEDLTDRQWRALSNALAVHRDDRTPNVAQFLDEFGAAGIPKLRSVVGGGEARQVPTIPAAAAPQPVSEPVTPYTSPVFAERAMPAEREPRGIAGKLFFLLLVIGAGVAVWYYQDPLRQFSTDLIADVQTRMNEEASKSEPASAGSQAPLAQGPAVTEDAPATVLAPGATPSSPVPSEPEATPPESATTQTSPAPKVALPPSERKVTPPVETRRPAPLPALTVTRPTAPAVATPQPTPAPPQPEPATVAASAEPPPPAARETDFSFQLPVTSVREGDVAARIVIQRSGDLSGSAEVSWWTADGTAVADRDYADLGARVERFAPGEKSRTVYVPLTNDAVPEPLRNFKVMLGRGDSARSGSVAGEMRVDIVDDD